MEVSNSIKCGRLKILQRFCQQLWNTDGSLELFFSKTEANDDKKVPKNHLVHKLNDEEMDILCLNLVKLMIYFQRFI